MYPSRINSSKTYQTRTLAETTPWGIDMVKALEVDDSNISNRNLCIVDSGYYRNHEDLQSMHTTGYSENTNWFEDTCGHGTHVAGTIAALGNNDKGVKGVVRR